MSETLGKWMTAIIVVVVMFTPILAYLDSLNREGVEVVLQQGAKRAAIEGYFTPEIISEMKQTLVEDYKFAEGGIKITATQTPTPRNQYISATVEVPRGMIFIVDIFDAGPTTIKKTTRIMSERIN